MTAEEKIMQKAFELFDVAGVTRQADGSSLLILGLETTPERNLDEFGRKGSEFIMYGFRSHVAHSIEALINYIHKKGFSAEAAGRYGYPLEGKINLKIEAIRAGLGQWGKNTIVLHPKYGPRLRFMAINTSARLQNPCPSNIRTEWSICRNCTLCIDACPVQVLEPYYMNNPAECLSNITSRNKEGRSILCDKCIAVCPAGTSAGKTAGENQPTYIQRI
jgi:ferredoxin